ncbi:MAG: Gfo/Idh/MocA family oxidoreductase [Chloroflexota bacterium]
MKQIALIGCGHIHTPGFVEKMNERPLINVKYVWDHDAERAQQNAALLGAEVISDPSTAWGEAALDAAVICSETDRHEDLVLAGAAAKKDLFVEKPLGFATADAYKMARAIVDAGVIFQTGYFMRGEPVHQFLRQQIQQGHFGRITRVRHSNCHSGSLGDWFTPRWLWMTDPAVAGVGAYGDLGTHSLDILLWWLVDGGENRVEKATAILGKVTSNYVPDCDEYGEGVLHFSDGTIATLAAGWVDVADPVRMLISGTEGHAHVSDGKLYFKSNHVDGADGKEPWTDLPVQLPHAFDLFLDAVLGNEPPAGHSTMPLVTPQEAAYRNAVMEALYDGAQGSEWAKVKEG